MLLSRMADGQMLLGGWVRHRRELDPSLAYFYRCRGESFYPDGQSGFLLNPGGKVFEGWHMGVVGGQSL